uniref:Uncharacterized protein n=1 Tax=viral metagenome TaxID=1070528 RepID=A0A6C0IA57_9ZZZZ
MAGGITAAALPVPTPLDTFANAFNANPYFIGLMMLILNLGGRFISLEVTKGQEKFFQNPWVRRFLIFTVLFVATRNLMVALLMTFVIVLFLGYLLNENSSLCLFGKGVKAEGMQGKPQGDSLTVEEMEILGRLQGKAQKFAAAKETTEENMEDVSAKVYDVNLKILQGR